MYPEDSQNSRFQFIASIVALVLPVLQVFLNFLPDSSKEIFLIKNYFLFVSIIAMVFSYIAIIAFKNNVYFEIRLRPKKEKTYEEYLRLRNSNFYNEEEIQENLRKTPVVNQPLRLTPNNVGHLIFIPLMVISYLVFFGLGLLVKDPSSFIVFLQGISYILLVVTTALSLAVYYIKELNSRRWEEERQARYRKIVDLCIRNNVFQELPEIKFQAQFQPNYNFMLLITIVRVNGRLYRITSDSNGKQLQLVESFDSMDDLIKNGGGNG